MHKMVGVLYFVIPLFYPGLCWGAVTIPKDTGPCGDMACPMGEVCREQKIECIRSPCPSSVGECRKLFKAGTCPWSKPALFGGCQRPKCFLDADCPGDWKCCGQCPSQCTAPAPKKGKCPALPPGLAPCTASCSNDASCPGSQKCCGSCPATCTIPEPEVKPGNCPATARWRGQPGPCMKKCGVDDDCPGSQKCCGSEVKYCTQPFKDGACSGKRSMRGPRCQFDFECFGLNKCCFGVCSPPLMTL